MSKDAPAPVTIGPNDPLSIHDLACVVHRGANVALSDEARHAVAEAHHFVERLVDERRIVYGITTGYGPLAGTYIDPSRSADLQRNLLHHLRAGVGPLLCDEHVLAMMVARAASLSLGHSGVRPQTLDLLISMINRRILPEVPSMGTVGASGDLTPLAHVAGAMLGEGRVRVARRSMSASQALAANGLTPLAPGPKEAIALVNGTSAMTGIAAVNGAEARAAMNLALRSAFLYGEVMGARAEAFDPRVGQVRAHPGQAFVHEQLERLAADSSRLERASSTTAELPRHDPDGGAVTNGVYAGRQIIQDPYSLRCIPQLYGAAFDSLLFHDAGVALELQSVTDNPLLFPEEDAVLQGGNFFGQHVAFASDALANALIVVAGHLERSIDRLTDPVRSNGLPPMLQEREPGVQSGFMGAQVTATSLHAEMRTRATPGSVQSIPTNAANQDVVTMGTIAARNAAWQMERVWELLSIQVLTLSQAAELRSRKDGAASPDEAGFSTSSVQLIHFVRERCPPLDNDRALSDEIVMLAQELRHDALSLS